MIHRKYIITILFSYYVIFYRKPKFINLFQQAEEIFTTTLNYHLLLPKECKCNKKWKKNRSHQVF